uniref:Uncharacterized protein n=1 Tax=Avena sativa TaxID=4498 RepID=A0ACD5TCG9_AVESA
MATPAPHFVDEILEEIFLRLPTPAELARASTTCPRFHRIITDRPFLRRFRKLHPPPLLGFVDGSRFLPVQAPHPSAPLARAFADAADFTYSFVPGCSRWVPCDARDGRVLLRGSITYSSTKLAVCDPLSRRYVLLPLIPKEMTAQQHCLADFGHKLATIGKDEDETSFKVVWTVLCGSKLMVFVYNSVTTEWSTSSSAFGVADPSWQNLGNLSRSSYLDGCFYWGSVWEDKLLVLDTRNMEFSTIDTGHIMQLVDLPGKTWCFSSAVDGTKGAVEMFTLVSGQDHAEPSFHLCHTIQQNNGESSDEWKLKSIIPLPLGFGYCTVDEAEGFMFLLRNRELQPAGYVEDLIISVEVKTSELKNLCGATRFHVDRGFHSYFGFPLSKPSL